MSPQRRVQLQFLQKRRARRSRTRSQHAILHLHLPRLDDRSPRRRALFVRRRLVREIAQPRSRGYVSPRRRARRRSAEERLRERFHDLLRVPRVRRARSVIVIHASVIPSRAAVMRLHRASQSAGWIARICPRARPSGLARPASAFVRAALCPRARSVIRTRANARGRADRDQLNGHKIY